jgi:DNA-binding transcriptional LysR family regulator
VLKLTREGQQYLESAHRVMDALEEAENGLEAEEPLFVVYPSKRNLSLRVRAFLDFLNDKFKAGWTGP